MTRPLPDLPPRSGGATVSTSGGGYQPARIAFELGLLALFAEAALATHQGFRGEVVLTEGQPFSGELAAYYAVDAGRTTPLLRPSVAFTPSSISPLHTGDGRIVDIKAKLVDAQGQRPVKHTTPFVNGSVSIGIEEIGLAPCIEIRAPARPPEGICANLAVWSLDSPPDTIVLPDRDLELEVRFFPDFQQTDEGVTTRSLRMEDPVLWLRAGPVLGGDSKSALLRPGDALRYGATTIRVAELRRWGRFTVTRHLPVDLLDLTGGLWLLAAGLAAWRWFGRSSTRRAR